MIFLKLLFIFLIQVNHKTEEERRICLHLQLFGYSNISISFISIFNVFKKFSFPESFIHLINNKNLFKSYSEHLCMSIEDAFEQAKHFTYSTHITFE